MNGDSFTVAIVDDHAFFREAANKYLTHLGFTVVLEATNGRVLLDQLESCPQLPDVCLLDVDMPILDGYETARYLRKRYPSVRILAISFLPDDRKKIRILEAGADQVVGKESEPHVLREALMATCGMVR